MYSSPVLIIICEIYMYMDLLVFIVVLIRTVCDMGNSLQSKTSLKLRFSFRTSV